MITSVGGGLLWGGGDNYIKLYINKVDYMFFIFKIFKIGGGDARQSSFYYIWTDFNTGLTDLEKNISGFRFITFLIGKLSSLQNFSNQI